jgi:hypothetical protein
MKTMTVWVAVTRGGQPCHWTCAYTRKECQKNAARELTNLAMIPEVPEWQDRWRWLRKRGYRAVKAKLTPCEPG